MEIKHNYGIKSVMAYIIPVQPVLQFITLFCIDRT